MFMITQNVFNKFCRKDYIKKNMNNEQIDEDG